MRTGPPPPDDRQRGNGHPGAAAASWQAGSLDASRARLTVVWALVLRRFREYAGRSRNPGTSREHRAEEGR